MHIAENRVYSRNSGLLHTMPYYWFWIISNKLLCQNSTNAMSRGDITESRHKDWNWDVENEICFILKTFLGVLGICIWFNIGSLVICENKSKVGETLGAENVKADYQLWNSPYESIPAWIWQISTLQNLLQSRLFFSGNVFDYDILNPMPSVIFF